MKEKRPVNRFRDVMWDYYRTNQKISREYAEANKEEDPGKFNRREKIYVVIIVIGLVGLVIKYLVL